MRGKLKRALIRAVHRLRSPPAVTRHRKLSERSYNGIKVVEIADQENLTVKVSERSDDGYHSYGNDWWTRPECPYSYKYLSINSMYPEAYFVGHGHPDHDKASDLVDYMQEVYRKLFGRQFESILELGCGGGEISKVLFDRKLKFISVEGTDAGVRRLRAIGIPADNILAYNLKFMPRLNRRFDIVMCTEVAEHIEPFFASKIIDNCIIHSDAVWFSAADRERAAHYHHMDELQIEAWDNLFAHMGFSKFVELDGRYGRASRVYLRNDKT